MGHNKKKGEIMGYGPYIWIYEDRNIPKMNLPFGTCYSDDFNKDKYTIKWKNYFYLDFTIDDESESYKNGDRNSAGFEMFKKQLVDSGVDIGCNDRFICTGPIDDGIMEKLGCRTIDEFYQRYCEEYNKQIQMSWDGAKESMMDDLGKINKENRESKENKELFDFHIESLKNDMINIERQKINDEWPKHGDEVWVWWIGNGPSKYTYKDYISRDKIKCFDNKGDINFERKHVYRTHNDCVIGHSKKMGKIFDWGDN